MTQNQDNNSPIGGPQNSPQSPVKRQITKVISGGQTGVDQAALRAAKFLGIETGGWMPAGWRTEDGPRPEFQQLYGMLQSHTTRYEFRTFVNVRDSNGTLWLGREGSPGFMCTLEAAKGCRKPFFSALGRLNEYAAIAKWIKDKNIHILNIAGNRRSTNPSFDQDAERIIAEILSDINGPPTNLSVE